MFEIDIRRIRACIDHKDYYSALQYAILVKDNYVSSEKKYFEMIIKNIKTGDLKNKLV